MGEVTVKFLGDEYQVSETIKEFLSYDKLLNPIREKILQQFAEDGEIYPLVSFSNDCNVDIDFNECADEIHEILSKYVEFADETIDILIKKLFELDIYDITPEYLLQEVPILEYFNKLQEEIFNDVLTESGRIIDMGQIELENAHEYAGRHIVGSGTRIITNSSSALMVNSMIEQSIISSQTRKAEKEYRQAADSIYRNAMNNLDIIYQKIIFEDLFPAISKVMIEFEDKIMNIFVNELIEHEKFDFSSIKKYNLQKADGMLSNINQVPDKIGFLKQAFLICPFSSKLYEECLYYEVLDKDTFETAKYFGMGDELSEKMIEYIKENLGNIDKIKKVVSILAPYEEIEELTMWKIIYKDKIENIIDVYATLKGAIVNKKILDKLVKENVICRMIEIIDKTSGYVMECIGKQIEGIITPKQFDNFVDIGILLPDDLRIIGSSEMKLESINNEIMTALEKSVKEYIEEANRRLNIYKEKKSLFDKDVKEIEEEINNLKLEKKKMGLFAFSGKKEISKIIQNKSTEIVEYKKAHNPQNYWDDFERMYR